jgi:tetratricopeptide (TPR) repeat protein
MVYDDQGDKAKALSNYKNALSVYEDIHELDGIAAAYNNIAGIYYQQNDFSKVTDYVLKSLDIRKKEGDKRKLSFTFLNIAALYYSMDSIELSIKYNLNGLQLAKQIGAKSQKRIAFKGLSDAYLKKGDFEKAYHYQILYSQVKDSIFEENKTRAIAEMHTKYETNKKEMENLLLKNENKVKSRNQIILIVIVAGLFLLLIMLIYYLRLRSKTHKQQKAIAEIQLAKKEQEKKHLQDKVFAEKQINRLQKEKFTNELVHKNEQLTNSTLSLINKNEVLGNLKKDVKSLDVSHDEKSKIVSYINQNLDMDADWKKFRLDFEEAHPGFFRRLKQDFPDLSETYQKICAFLRIDLTSKEIADLLYVSIAAVNKNRQRLRKKLNLEAEADLNEFLKKL